MRIHIAVAGLAVLISGGLGYWLANTGQDGDSSIHSTMASMTAGLEGKQGADFEHAFLMEMIVHHEGAVAMAQQVLEKSQRPELVQLANDIIRAQTSEIQTMQGWMDSWFGHTN